MVDIAHRHSAGRATRWHIGACFVAPWLASAWPAGRTSRGGPQRAAA